MKSQNSEILHALRALLNHANRLTHGDHLEPVPEVVCAKGLKFSMQASVFHYCSPRSSVGPWTSVEIGFPNKRVAAWLEYAEQKEKPTKTVYGRVPLKLVAEVVAANGGLK